MYEHVISRDNAKQYNRTPEYTIAKLLQFGHLCVFFYCDQLYITYIAMLMQQTVVPMVIVMTLEPILVRNKAQHTTSLPNDIIELLMSGERLVPTIMLNDEDTHQKEAIDNSQAKGDPEAIVHA